MHTYKYTQENEVGGEISSDLVAAGQNDDQHKDNGPTTNCNHSWESEHITGTLIINGDKKVLIIHLHSYEDYQRYHSEIKTSLD